MSNKKCFILYWLPRILGILLVISTIAYLFESPVDEIEWYYIGVGLLPVLFISALIAIAWHKEIAGGIFFVILGLVYSATSWNSYPLAVQFRLALPMVTIGILFIVSYLTITRKATNDNKSNNSLK